MPYCSAKAALETLGAGRKGIVWKGSVAHSGAGRVLPLLIYDLSWQVWADLAPQANSCFLLYFHHASKQQLLHPPLDKYADHEVMYSYFYCSRNVSGWGWAAILVIPCTSVSPQSMCLHFPGSFLSAKDCLQTGKEELMGRKLLRPPEGNHSVNLWPDLTLQALGACSFSREG